VRAKNRIAIVSIDRSVQNRTSACNGGPALDEIRDELLELFYTIRLFIHMQQPRVPGGLPRIVERFRGEFLFTGEVAVDAPFFRLVASISSLSELPSYPRLLKIGAAASTIFRRVCWLWSLPCPFSIGWDHSVRSNCIAPGLWMDPGTKRSHKRATNRLEKMATEWSGGDKSSLTTRGNPAYCLS
jgi:hypothetical protein